MGFFAYDFLRKEVIKHYKQQFNKASQNDQEIVISDLRNALFGLEILSDNKIEQLVKNPEAHYYIVHNLPLPRKFRKQSENKADSKDYNQAIHALKDLGLLSQKKQRLRNKLQPILILTAVLSVGSALFAANSKHSTKIPLTGAIASLALLVHNKEQNNMLPPFPKKPDLTH